MTWFKVDDTLAFHRKVVAAGNAAMGLWVRAGSWCAQQPNDGHVPAKMIGKLGGKKRDADRLVAVVLWHKVEDGYVFHEWEQANPTRAEILEGRSQAAARKRRSRRRVSPDFGQTPPLFGQTPPDFGQQNGHPPSSADSVTRDSRARVSRPDP